MDADFVQFQVPAAGGDGSIAAILRAHSRHQAVRSLRLSSIHVLAVLGGLMALTIGFPTAAPPWLRDNLAMAWAVCGAGTALATIAEWAWYRHRSRLLADNRLLVALDEGGDGGPPP